MWIALFVGVISSAAGIVATVALGVIQISEARIASTQTSGFLADWRADATFRIAKVGDAVEAILVRVS